MKVIFLDIDGELTYSNYQNEQTKHIDLEKVAFIKEICNRTGAKVVISSSWRMCAGLYGFLVELLSEHNIEIIGKTDYIPTESIEGISELIALTMTEDLGCTIKHGTGRAAEIEKWLKENKTENFVILDDEDWDWADYEYDKHWVQPSWFDDGLQREHVEKAIEILNRKGKEKF